MEETIALVSDIHGNRWALEAVLADIRERKITTILNLGDSLYGPLDPMGTYTLIRENGFINLSGNEDRLLAVYGRSRENHKTMDYVLSHITPEVLSWLEALPFDYEYNKEVYCCHGTPAFDTEYLLEDVRSGQPVLKENTAIHDQLQRVTIPVICCGHSHLSHVIQTEKYLIINPGSVGCPAYDDDIPVYHRMESGTPRARYTFIKMGQSGVTTAHISVEYDTEKAARTAEKNGHDNWGFWLRTGRALFQR